MFTPVQFMLRTVLLIAVAIIANAIAKKIVVKLIQRLAARTKTDWDDILVRNNVFRWLSHLAPGLVIYYGCLGLYPELELNGWIQRVAMAYMGVILLMVVNSALNAVVDIYRASSGSQGRPIKGLVQMIQITIWAVGVITLVALLMNQSPWKFLTGIGALSAVLLLVFKDSILGLVASFQMSANNMVRIGDWIEMPKYGADGDVIDISLNTVKVQNWDKTISTIPTYALVADPVKNWRGMSESGGRRIKRAICIDMQTVTFCSDEMLDRFENFEHVATYLKERRGEIEAFNKEHRVDIAEVINGRRITNLGTFRAYIVGYLRHHPLIHTEDMTFLVRQLAPTEHGLPIEIYVFSRDQVWANYESIQADIFDHIIAAVPEFDLAVFQSPTGRDFRGMGGAGK